MIDYPPINGHLNQHVIRRPWVCRETRATGLRKKSWQGLKNLTKTVK